MQWLEPITKTGYLSAEVCARYDVVLESILPRQVSNLDCGVDCEKKNRVHSGGRSNTEDLKAISKKQDDRGHFKQDDRGHLSEYKNRRLDDNRNENRHEERERTTKRKVEGGRDRDRSRKRSTSRTR